ncbi:Fc.00g040450.m01.CDS01 [Cosmosporella sp. VM-42]
MSIPSLVQVFKPGMSAPHPSALDALVRHQLEIAARDIAASERAAKEVREARESAMSMPSDPPPASTTIISDMGEYLTQAAQILSCLTNKLLDDSQVEEAIFTAHEQSRIQTKVTDLSTIVHMDVQHSRLCKIRDLTEKFSREVQDVWRPDPGAMVIDSPCPPTAFSPFRDSKRASLTRFSTSVSDVDTKVHNSQKMLPSSQPSFSQSSPTGNASGTDDSEEDEDEQFSRIDMEALKQRGKGSYYCPLAHRCDKGGVDKDGNLVLFDRNSSFAYASHLDRPAYLELFRSIRDSLTPITDNIATNIENPGGAMFPVAPIHPRNASLPAEMV